MLRKLLSKEKAADSPGSIPVLPRGTEKAIWRVVGSGAIPTMPAAAQKAFELSTDPTAEARDFIEVIESDEALSARVLKVANSVYFDRGTPSNTIAEAVVVIGNNELSSLLSATTLSEVFPSSHTARAQLWANDLATGLIAKSLARKLLSGKEDLAFMGGLMHDIGKLLLLQRAAPTYSKVISHVGKSGVSFAEAEGEIFPFDHTEVGQLIGQRWNFSPELLEVIRTHHYNWEALVGSTTSITLPGIVKTADLLAHSAAIGHPKGFTTFQNTCDESLGEAYDYLDIPSAQRRDFTEECRRNFDLEYELYLSGPGI